MILLDSSKALRRVRTRAKISQKDLAKTIPVHINTIQLAEKGSNIRLSTLLTWVDACGYEVVLLEKEHD